MTNNSTGILSLAVELVLEILFYIKAPSNSPFQADFCTLRLVCRQLKIIIDADFLSVINFDFIKTTKAASDHVRHLADGNASAIIHCKNVQIETRGIRYDAQGLVGLLQDESFKPSLARAIRSLQNVKAVSWDIQTISLIGPIMDGLTALPQLEELDLRFNFDYQSEGFPDVFPLYQFSRLRRIAVVNVRGGDFFTDLTKQLAKVIVKSPLLEHLEYVWPKTFNGGIPRFKGQQNYIPHSMILGVPKEQNPFRRLAFQGRNIITKHTLSHLRHVSALSMSELAVSKYDNIWQILSAARIYLKDISVDTMDQHLVNYLMSYSGLEKFSIVYSRWSPVTESNPEAVQFYADALPRHRNSLTCLVISSTTPTNWCITGEYMSLVLKCRRLKELSVTLDFDEIHHVEAVKQVISKALELPHLRILNILTSGTRQRFGCGTGTIRYRAQTLHTLEGVIESLEIGKFVRGLELCRILAHQVEYVAGMADDGRMRFLKKRVAGDAGRRTDMFFF